MACLNPSWPLFISLLGIELFCEQHVRKLAVNAGANMSAEVKDEKRRLAARSEAQIDAGT